MTLRLTLDNLYPTVDAAVSAAAYYKYPLREIFASRVWVDAIFEYHRRYSKTDSPNDCHRLTYMTAHGTVEVFVDDRVPPDCVWAASQAELERWYIDQQAREILLGDSSEPTSDW